jgi:NAD(P)-dependent dehydrogenase (short-subunit alcohol dehydrogenase family)
LRSRRNACHKTKDDPQWHMLVDPRRSSKPQPTLVDRAAGVLRVKPGEKQEFDSMQLNDVAVVITGGGSGLGAATARAMAAKGARVAVLDVSKENAGAVAAEIKGLALVADVTDENAVKQALELAETKHGPARVLINCAGIGVAIRTVSKNGPFPLEAFTRVINVNLIGSFNVLRLTAARLSTCEPIGEERGVIINTASVAAFDGQIGQAAYSASKGGIVGMTLPIARDLAQNLIRVNTIAPGLFLTPLLMGLSEEARRSLGAQVPHPARLGDPKEYAALAVHIVENPMLNGETIRLDGAIRMAPR